MRTVRSWPASTTRRSPSRHSRSRPSGRQRSAQPLWLVQVAAPQMGPTDLLHVAISTSSATSSTSPSISGTQKLRRAAQPSPGQRARRAVRSVAGQRARDGDARAVRMVPAQARRRGSVHPAASWPTSCFTSLPSCCGSPAGWRCSPACRRWRSPSSSSSSSTPCFAFVQERRADHAAERLRALLPRSVVVRRDGNGSRSTPATSSWAMSCSSTPGIVSLPMPRPRRDGLLVDTSMLTGESEACAVEAGDAAVRRDVRRRGRGRGCRDRDRGQHCAWPRSPG